MTRRAAVLTATLLGASPGMLWAQEALHGWSRLSSAGQPTVHVLPDVGTEVTGKLLRVDADSIVLLAGGIERRFEQVHVKRIDRRGDSLRNGALVGVGVGAVFGLLAALIADCPAPEPGGPCPGTRAAGFAVSLGAYAALGVGIDALVAGRTTLYEPRPVSSPSTRQPPREPVTLRIAVRW